MLQKVISESRKSSTLKKWLLLLARLGLIAALVIAFAQPFSSTVKALKPMETVIYLDNSFSMQAKSDGVALLKKAVQELIQNVDQEVTFSLFTNDFVFKDVTIKNIQNDLLSLNYSQDQYSLNDVALKAETLFSGNTANTKKLLLFSDFQGVYQDSITDESIEAHYVQLQPNNAENITIDSVFLTGSSLERKDLDVLLSGGSDVNTPVSLYNSNQLIAKAAAIFDAQGKATVEFSLPEQTQIDGRLELNDTGLTYDNRFFFTINNTKVIKILAISEANIEYLQKLFPADEFSFEHTTLSRLNYSLVDAQNLVILDNLTTIPESLRRTLKNYHDNGGSLIIIPSMQADLESYNTLLGSLGSIVLKEPITIEQGISDISFEHPLFQNVFEKNVTNFQYPKVLSYFTTTSNASKMLSFASGEPFLMGSSRLYLFTAALTSENSNFKNSPLIVPTFYNMAQFSLKSPDLYYVLGEDAQTDVEIALGKDEILTLAKNGLEIIPRQQTFNTKVSLFFGENPSEDGIFSIQGKDSILEKVSFNYSRKESKLQYADINTLKSTSTQNSIASLFDFIKSENSKTMYWKWFIILALIFALVEVLIQKLLS